MLSGKRKRRNGGRTCFRLGLPLSFDGVDRPEDALDSCGEKGEDEVVGEVVSDEGGGRWYEEMIGECSCVSLRREAG